MSKKNQFTPYIFFVGGFVACFSSIFCIARFSFHTDQTKCAFITHKQATHIQPQADIAFFFFFFSSSSPFIPPKYMHNFTSILLYFSIYSLFSVVYYTLVQFSLVTFFERFSSRSVASLPNCRRNHMKIALTDNDDNTAAIEKQNGDSPSTFEATLCAAFFSSYWAASLSIYWHCSKEVSLADLLECRIKKTTQNRVKLT